MCQKRPTHVSKETYTCLLLGRNSLESKGELYEVLHMCQKRPTHVSKETYTCVKRDLHMFTLYEVLYRESQRPSIFTTLSLPLPPPPPHTHAAIPANPRVCTSVLFGLAARDMLGKIVSCVCGGGLGGSGVGVGVWCGCVGVFLCVCVGVW
jgi:hypothetical protein